MKSIDLSKYEILPNPNPDGNGIVAKAPNNDQDLLFMYQHVQRVDFDEYPDHAPEDAVIRIMPQHEGCKIQFRTNQVPKKNGYKGKGKPKNMSAIGYLSIYDLELIIQH